MADDWRHQVCVDCDGTTHYWTGTEFTTIQWDRKTYRKLRDAEKAAYELNRVQCWSKYPQLQNGQNKVYAGEF